MPAPAWTATAPRSLALLSTHTRESVETTYWTGSGYDAAALARIDILLRDHRTDEVKPIDPLLLDLLHALSVDLRANESFHVISGYRSPATNARLRAASEGVATNSLHLKGRAIDIRLPGVELGALRRTALDLRRGGVGYYPRSNFVHVDTGRVRTW